MEDSNGQGGPAPHKKANAGGAGGRAFFRRADVWLIAALLLAGLIWLALGRGGPGGAVAQVSVTEGDAAENFEVELAGDRTLHIEGAGGIPVTLQVKDGAIRFVNAQCPDHRCEGFGWLKREGEWALCAPAGVLVSVREN